MLRILAYWCSWPDDRSKRPAEPFPCYRCDDLISENVRDYWREGETESVIEMFPACKNSCSIWTKKVEAFHWFLSCVLSFSCVTFNKFKESYKHFTFLESGPTERSLKLYLSAYFIQGSFMKWRQKRTDKVSNWAAWFGRFKYSVFKFIALLYLDYLPRKYFECTLYLYNLLTLMFSCRCQPWCPSLTRCAWAATWCPPPASPTSQPTVCTQHLFYIPVLFYMYILYKFSLTYFRSSIKCKNIHKHTHNKIHIINIHNSYPQNPQFISSKS